MKALYLAIKAQLDAKVPGLFIHIFNNQFDLTENKEMYSFPYPAVFVEFINDQPIEQLGGGYQIYNPLTVRIHIAHDFYNNSDGTMEQNLLIFDVKDSVYKALQKFEPAGAVQFIRTSETQDYDHTNIYHFIQDYTTNYVDQNASEPVNGVLSGAPITLQLTTTAPGPYTKTI